MIFVLRSHSNSLVASIDLIIIINSMVASKLLTFGYHVVTGVVLIFYVAVAFLIRPKSEL